MIGDVCFAQWSVIRGLASRDVNVNRRRAGLGLVENAENARRPSASRFERPTKTVFTGKRPSRLVEGNELEVGQSEHFPARSGSRPTPSPGSSRGRSAMALETPPHVGRRPGSLRASDGASSSGVKSASSEVSAAESMRAVAARLEKHTATLRSAMDQTSRLDDGSASGASAEGAVAVAAARALDADAASSSSEEDALDAAAHETRLRSYRTADAHIKKAAAKIAGHKKWYADRANAHKKATESCASALDELRLASMVLQRRHDEDSVSSAGAARTTSRGASETKNNDDNVQNASSFVDSAFFSAQSVVVDALVATARKLRVDADKIAARELEVQTRIARAERRRDDAVAEARAERVARETAPVKIIVKRVPPASFFASKKTFSSSRPSSGETKSSSSAKTKKEEKRDPLREAARATLSRNAESVATLKKEKKKRDDEKNDAPKPVDPNPELVDALRAATEARDDLERRLRETQKRLETQTRALEVSLGDAAERAEASESRARSAAEEGARWRALYVAMRDDLHRGVGADEAEALRASLRRAEDAHRRELTLLGAEHGNQCASLRRALADTERERVSAASAVDASRRAATRAEEALVAERESRREAEVLKRRSDGELRRVSKRCEALEADVESLKKSLEETERASRDLRKAIYEERDATREADLNKTRDDASRDVDWRVESLEGKLLSALESAKREKTRADDAERALDDARRRAVEQQARMAEAARARKRPDAE